VEHPAPVFELGRIADEIANIGKRHNAPITRANSATSICAEVSIAGSLIASNFAGSSLFPAQTAGNALTPAVALSPPRVGSPRGCEHGLGLSRSPLATAPMPKEQSEDRGRQPRNVVQQVEALHPLE
jgi:hypothetical protein